MTNALPDYNNVEPIDPKKPMIIPGLGIIYLDVDDPKQPVLRIVLSDDYQGDLRDVVKGDAPDAPYLVCNHMTAKDNRRLAMFMEAMTLYDYTGDGEPDCSHVIERIEQALYETDDKPRNFRRPTKGLYTRLVMLIMPPSPRYHIIMGYDRLQDRFRKRYHAYSVLLFICFAGLVLLQNHFLPWMQYSVVSGFLTLSDAVGIPTWIGIVLFVVGLRILWKLQGDGESLGSSISQHTVGFFSKSAVYEEQAFREGSEDWNFQQRVRSCLAFGLIHMVNLIYPLATILPLALGGAVFMAVYLRSYRRTASRRAAVLRAAVWHRVYNRIALTVAVVTIVTSLGFDVVGLFTASVLIFGSGLVFRHYRAGRQTSHDNTPVMAITFTK